MKKILACVLCVVMLAAALAGCGSSQSGKASEKTTDEKKTAESQAAGNTVNEKESENDTAPAGDLESNNQSAAENAVNLGDGFEGRNDIAYVLIYNPEIWQESNTDQYGTDLNPTLTTGDIGSQIDPLSNKADGLAEDPQIIPYAQSPFTGLPEGVELDPESGRAGGLQPVYSEGERHEFFIGMGNRRKETLECLYAGKYCYIWSDGTISSEDAKKYGEEFDNVIYPADVETFGTARFTDEGGKVNILYYLFEADEKFTAGFFRPGDLYSSTEVDKELIERFGVNVDHAIINVNSLFCAIPELLESVYSTQAHEFQHLICQTDLFEAYYNSWGGALGTPDLWLNEAMSGYIEEELYPGVQEKDGHYNAFARSDLIRHGQSLYNFATDVSVSPIDIGTYGSVFVFTQYLRQKAGAGIFHKIHDYYRSGTNMDLTTPTALYSCVPEDFVKEINSNYIYPSNLTFASEGEEWMSKMTLDFYLSMLRADLSDPDAYAKIQAQTLLYDEINPADIEGGGRVIAETKDGTFKIPDDSDYGLMYIGLDKEFRPVTYICYR